MFDPDDFRQWIDRNGDAPCTCGHSLREHFADLSGCPTCDIWEPIHHRCQGFNLDRKATADQQDAAWYATANDLPTTTETEQR